MQRNGEDAVTTSVRYNVVQETRSEHYRLRQEAIDLAKAELPPWFVITGAPCAGKTSTIDLLASTKPDWQIVPEAAQILIERGERGDCESEFSKKVLELKLRYENALDKQMVVVFDRGIPDTLAYLEASDTKLEDLHQLQLERRYAKVFLFDRLPFLDGGKRNSFDREHAEFLDKRLEQIYRELNYEIVRVPVTSIEQRAKLVAEQISDYLGEKIGSFSMPTRNQHNTRLAVYLILEKEDKVLLLRRKNTGYEDGQYSLIAGHVEVNESLTAALIREAKEEAGIDLNEHNLALQRIIHRKDVDKKIYLDFFFRASDWNGEPKNLEPHKCDELSWCSFGTLPKNIIEHVRKVLENPEEGYEESGF